MNYSGLFGILAYLTIAILTASPSVEAAAPQQWSDPFPATTDSPLRTASGFTLAQVLRLVATNNSELVGLVLADQVSEGLIAQAGVWSNPELELEMEEVGWDRPGISESEFRVGLAQEVALWGSRGARQRVARRDRDAARVEQAFARFDLYAETKRRFYTLAYAQTEVTMTTASVDLAVRFNEAIAERVKSGAGLQAELLMSELELQRVQLEHGDALSRLAAAQLSLAAMYVGDTTGLVAVDDDLALAGSIDAARWEHLLKGSRGIAGLNAQEQVLRARLDLEARVSKPNLTLSAGYTRLQAEKANTFVAGLSFPIPLLDRNHGTRAGLVSETESLIEMRRQAVSEAQAEVRTSVERLRRLEKTYETLDNQILPKANQTMKSVEAAYDAGGLAYTAVLDAARTLVEFRARANDLRRDIRMQHIEVESILGIPFERLLTIE